MKKLHFRTMVLCGVVICILTIATILRNRVWHSQISLYSDVVKKSPNKARGYILLARSTLDTGDIQESIKLYQKVVQVVEQYPDQPQAAELRTGALTSLSAIYLKLGYKDPKTDEIIFTHLDLAQAALDRVFKENPQPDDHEAYENLGVLFLRRRRPDLALRVLLTALTRFPDDQNLMLNVGYAYAALHQCNLAVALWHRAFDRNPDFLQVQFPTCQ